MYARRAKIRCYGRISLTVCMVLFTYAWVIFNVIFLGRIVPAVGPDYLIFILGIPANLLWILAVWSYLRCGLTDPGRIADEWREFVKGEPGINIVEGKAEWQPGQATTSDKTPEVRPERAHYCKVCNVDVLRMDHFCPWVGNCIGFRNYKFFLLAMIYLDLSCLVGLAAVVGVVLVKICASASRSESNVWFLSTADTVLLSSLVVLAILAFGAFTYVFCHHFPKALRNITSIENKYKNMRNPYDQFTRKENLAQVFGAFGWDWFLPVMPRRPQSDGFSFRTSNEVLPDGLVEMYADEEDGIIPLLRELADHSQGLIEDSESDEISRIEDIWRYRYTQRHEVAVANEEDDGEDEEVDEGAQAAKTALICCRRKKKRTVKMQSASSAAASPAPPSQTTATATPPSAPLLPPRMASLPGPAMPAMRLASQPVTLRPIASSTENLWTLQPVQLEPKVSAPLPLPAQSMRLAAAPGRSAAAAAGTAVLQQSPRLLQRQQPSQVPSQVPGVVL